MFPRATESDRPTRVFDIIPPRNVCLGSPAATKRVATDHPMPMVGKVGESYESPSEVAVELFEGSAQLLSNYMAGEPSTPPVQSKTSFIDYAKKLSDLCTKIGLAPPVFGRATLCYEYPSEYAFEVTLKLGELCVVGYGDSKSSGASAAAAALLIELLKAIGALCSIPLFGKIGPEFDFFCTKVGLLSVVSRTTIRSDFPKEREVEVVIFSGYLFCHDLGSTEETVKDRVKRTFCNMLKDAIEDACPRERH